MYDAFRDFVALGNNIWTFYDTHKKCYLVVACYDEKYYRVDLCYQSMYEMREFMLMKFRVGYPDWDRFIHGRLIMTKEALDWVERNSSRDLYRAITDRDVRWAARQWDDNL